MIEYVPLLLGVAAFLPKGKMDDRKKIDEIFKAQGFCVNGDQYPVFIKKIPHKNYMGYLYSKPLGLMGNEVLEDIVSHSLSKPVKMTGEREMIVKVYKEHDIKPWSYEDAEGCEGWNIPVGMSLDGMVWHDFDKIPHMTVAGATTMGKTVFMKMMTTSLIENHPDDVEFYILDLKGGLAFHRYKNLKQVKVVAGDYKQSSDSLKMVKRDIKKDMDYLKSINEENVKDAGLPKRKFIIVDEAGELVPHKSMSDEDKEHTKKCQEILSYIARVSGQLGYRLIFGTQYPTSEILDRQIKANASAKVAFRLETATHSRVALDQDGAELLDRPGKAIYKTVDEHIVQTPKITNKDMWERLGRWEDATVGKEDDSGQSTAPKFG